MGFGLGSLEISWLMLSGHSSNRAIVASQRGQVERCVPGGWTNKYLE